MISLEMLAMNLPKLLLMPIPVIALFAIFGIMKLLEKPIIKQMDRMDSCALWQEIVCSGFEVVPAGTARRSGDIKA